MGGGGGALTPVWLLTERPAEAHGLLGGAVSEHGLQPGPALHPEHAQVGVGGGGRRCPGPAGLGSTLFRAHRVPPPLCFCCSLATDFLPTFMYCMSSGNFDVVQTALRNLPEYVLLCQGEATPPPLWTLLRSGFF